MEKTSADLRLKNERIANPERERWALPESSTLLVNEPVAHVLPEGHSGSQLGIVTTIFCRNREP